MRESVISQALPHMLDLLKENRLQSDVVSNIEAIIHEEAVAEICKILERDFGHQAGPSQREWYSKLFEKGASIQDIHGL